MKPRLFIGSSTESIEVANALQANLDYDAVVTIWNQGIFNLSSDTLSDLLSALNTFDFAVFIFQPNDVTTIRSNTFSTVRDNVIFELGLFLGRLGKDKVFYLTDRSITDLHLPTDLIGLTAGTYDGQREDGNLQAALGPFCFEVRKHLKNFIYENLIDLEGEKVSTKRLAIDKPPYWEYLLAIELLNTKLDPVNTSYDELTNDVVVQRKTNVNYKELYQFIRSSLATHVSISAQFQKSLEELTNAFGKPGVSGNALEIKKAIDHMVSICKELLAWEYELNSLSTHEDLVGVKNAMGGWSEVFISAINSIAPQLHKIVEDDKIGIKPVPITFILNAPARMGSLPELFASYILKHNITEPLL
jgi:hypothetical protein